MVAPLVNCDPSTMTFRRIAAVTGVLVALACFLTWPQCLHLATRVAAHDDGLFSPWRLAWIGHALQTDPARLYDANIFYPDRGTLANSDAVILLGALAHPFLWAGVSPIAVYNVLLLGGIVTSGLAMFALARHLIGDDEAALVASAVFMMVPYRVEHFEHLELQWACFIPLTFLAVHRAFEGPSVRQGLLAGVLVWLQLTVCVYYGVFLGLVTGALSVLLLVTGPHRTKKHALVAITGLLAGGLVAACLTVVSLQPYLDNVTRVGVRETSEIGIHSAVASSYLSAPIENWFWGWTSSMFTGDELHLFPGVIASALALVGLAFAPRRRAVVYGVILALAVELSFGLNGWLYSWLHRHLFLLQGLRATARASILGFCALALLAGFGVRLLRDRWPRRLWAPGLVFLVALGIEYGSAPMRLQPAPETPPIYQLLRKLSPGVVAELPMPRPDGGGSAYDTLYMFSSLSHWFPLVNGYSGFIPAHYLKTMELMGGFPDEASIGRLKQLGTRYVIVHEHGYTPEEYLAIIVGLRARGDIVAFGRYGDVEGLHAELFELASSEPSPSSESGGAD